MKRIAVSFPCGNLRLEGLCLLPDGDGTFPGVVLCHPHPLYGGSMDNNVTMAVASALTGRGIIAFMFNFRGVGRSQGSFGNGVDEQQDVAAALGWVSAHPQANPQKLGVMGYSFGAAVALPVACADERAKAVAVVSLPAEMAPMDAIRRCRKPKLFVWGGRDPFTAQGRAEEMYKAAAEPKQFHLVPQADHFWWGIEEELAEKVARFFSRTLAV